MTSPMGKLFQTVCMTGEKSLPNFKGKQLSSVFTQKFQYRRPFRIILVTAPTEKPE